MKPPRQLFIFLPLTCIRVGSNVCRVISQSESGCVSHRRFEWCSIVLCWLQIWEKKQIIVLRIVLKYYIIQVSSTTRLQTKTNGKPNKIKRTIITLVSYIQNTLDTTHILSYSSSSPRPPYYFICFSLLLQGRASSPKNTRKDFGLFPYQLHISNDDELKINSKKYISMLVRFIS